MSIKITGIRYERKGDESDYDVFDLEDVNFIATFKPRFNADTILRYHTIKGIFLGIHTLEGIRIALRPYGFEPLDNINAVHMKKIIFVAEKYFEKRVYFADGTYTTVSRPHYHLIKDFPVGDCPD